MSKPRKPPVGSTRGRKPKYHFLFDDLCSYPDKLQQCFLHTQKQLQEMVNTHSGHAVALKLQLGLSSTCCASMNEMIPDGEHYIKDLHEKAAQYVEDTTKKETNLPIDPHVVYVDAENLSGLIVQASNDLALELDNATYNPGEINYEEGTTLMPKGCLDMPKEMCKLAVSWGLLGFNMRVTVLRTRHGVREMMPQLPRPVSRFEQTQHMANNFSRALQKKFFSKFKIPKENKTPKSDCPALRSKLEKKFGVSLPVRVSAQRLGQGASNGQSAAGEPIRASDLMAIPEEDFWMSDEEMHDDMQGARDRNGSREGHMSLETRTCFIMNKTREEEEEDEIIKHICGKDQANHEHMGWMEDEGSSWYQECLGNSTNGDDMPEFGEVGEEREANEPTPPEAASTVYAKAPTLDGGCAVEAPSSGEDAGTSDAKAPTLDGGCAVEVPTLGEGGSTGDAKRKRKKSVGASTKEMKRPREESMSMTALTVQENTAQSARTDARASGMRKKKRGSRWDRVLFAGFM